MATRDDVSSDLDFLAGTEVGTIIVRGTDLWQALIPLTNGNVLTTHGTGALPTWDAPVLGAGQFTVASTPGNVASGSAYAFKGNPLAVSQPVTIRSVGCHLVAVNAHTYRGSLYQVDGSLKITSILSETATVTGLTAGLQVLTAELSAPITITPGNFYVAGWRRTDGTDTFAFPSSFPPNDEFVMGFPHEWYIYNNSLTSFARLAKAAPAVNDTFNNAAGSIFTQSMVISI